MRRLAAVLVFLAALTSPAAAEDILSYDVVVDVRQDGSLDYDYQGKTTLSDMSVNHWHLSAYQVLVGGPVTLATDDPEWGVT